MQLIIKNADFSNVAIDIKEKEIKPVFTDNMICDNGTFRAYDTYCLLSGINVEGFEVLEIKNMASSAGRMFCWSDEEVAIEAGNTCNVVQYDSFKNWTSVNIPAGAKYLYLGFVKSSNPTENVQAATILLTKN
jgi:hypothetical protein